MIESDIAYWKNLINTKDTGIFIDVYDILDSLEKEKYDLIHGTHTLNIKVLNKRINLFESLMDTNNIFKRRKYKREMNLIQERVDYLKKIDSETLDKGFAKTLKV